jgi:hypothetical protein
VACAIDLLKQKSPSPKEAEATSPAHRRWAEEA